MKRLLTGALLLVAAATAACDQTVAATPHSAPGAATAPAAPTSCAGTGPEVTTAEALQAALAAAKPGSTVRLAAGRYPGHFALTTAGTADAPITVCGPRDAVLDGSGGGEKGGDDGYTLHLDHADHVRVAGFTVRGGQKGVMVDASSHAVLDGLLVTDVGEEGVHLRRGSSDDVVRGVTVRNTGLRTKKFGEGIYVGSAQSNWCTYSDCQPDRSDRNLLEGNDIAGTTAESVDVKEGTTGGTLRGNTFSGAGMTAAKTWVNVKGNEWQIVGNTGTDAPEDGFQTHRILDGWGARNAFADNRALVNGPGYGINITKAADGNSVACSNTAEAADKGLTNITCS